MKPHAYASSPPLTRPKQETRHTLRTILCALVLILAVGLIAARLYLPYWVRDYVNDQIDALHGYSGSVGTIDIALWRGAYVIHDLEIYKTRGREKLPFVAADTVDLSVQWGALLHGRVVAKAVINDAAITFSQSQTGKGADWITFIKSLTPFDINNLTINGGKMAYVDYAASPAVNLYVTNVHASVTNLRNVDVTGSALPSDLSIRGTSIGKGALDIRGGINILRDVPDFNIKFKLENASLPAFNNFMRKIASIDFNGGTLSVYSELAGVKGHIIGYVKPIATKVDMVSIKQAGSPLHLAWETIAAAFMEVFKNHPRDQFALKIPVNGTINNPQGDMWTGFWSIFANAFGTAFPRATDGTIDFNHALKAYGEDPRR